MDSIGKKGDYPEKTIFLYSDDNLMKIKKLDFNNKEQPDDKSEYQSYTYDNKNRIITEKQYMYFDDENEASCYNISTKYDDLTNTSVSINKEKGKVFIKTVTISNSKQEILNIKEFDGDDKILYEKIFTYNIDNQITKLIAKNTGMADECPEYGNFEDIFSYSNIKLIDTIKHHYKNTICEMRFVYK